MQTLIAQELTIYDFENLSPGLVAGQDNWQVLGCHTYQPTIVTSDNQGEYNGSNALQITSLDLGNQHSNCDRLNDESWWVPEITDSTDFFIVDIDMNGGYWGKEFSLCYDKNLDGNFTEGCFVSDQNEKGISILKSPQGTKLFNKTILLAQDNLIPEWATYRLVIDLKAYNNLGSISAFHKYLPNNTWSEFTNIQNIQANFDFEADNGLNPKKYNGMKIENAAGSTVQYDNIKLRTINRIEDIYVCNDLESFNIEVSKDIPEAEYEWSDGSTANSIIINEVGTYFLKIILDGHTAIVDTFEVNYHEIETVLDLGQDQIICNQDTIALDAGQSFESYLWNTGETTHQLNVFNEGNYFVEAIDENGCSFIDSITLVFFNETLNLGRDTVLCMDSSIVIGKEEDSNAQYLWNTGEINNHIQVNEGGTYILEYTKNGCTLTDTIEIHIHEQIELGNDTVICKFNSLSISTSQDYDHYLWNTLSENEEINIEYPGGKYWVTAQKDDCFIPSDTLTVTFDSIPYFSEYLINDTLICDKEPFELKVEAKNHEYILWFNDSQSDNTLINSAGDYWVEAYNHCGYVRDNVEISTENCNCYFFIPNSFTPNGDEINDFYSLKMNCDPVYIEWGIYDRWGSRIYYSKDHTSSWDGRYKENNYPIGIYIVKVKIKYKHSAEETYIREISLFK